MNAAPMSIEASVMLARLPPCASRNAAKGVHRGGVLTFRDIDHLAARHVHEQADVVVTPARRRLVRRDLRDLGPLEPVDGLRGIMIEHPPDPRVVLLADLG